MRRPPEACNLLSPQQLRRLGAVPDVELASYTTLGAGGAAEWLLAASDVETLAAASISAYENEHSTHVLGWGSNVLVADQGVAGLVLWNKCRQIKVARTGEVVVDTGCLLQEMFLKVTQAGLGGMAYGVGIPGTVGGALVSNAGAYRSSISQHLTELEIVENGTQKIVGPEWLEFGYRDSKLRSGTTPYCVLLRASFQFAPQPAKAEYDAAREYQRQRISKQPPQASAGSFFKNVLDSKLAQTLPRLPESLRDQGVIPAGYLIEAVGMRGFRIGQAGLGERHANFLINFGGATASDLRRVTERSKLAVYEIFGVTLEEEVLFFGDWSDYQPTTFPIG